MDPPNYRLRFLFSVLRGFIVPPLVVFVASYYLRMCRMHICVLLSIMSIPLNIILRSFISTLSSQRTAYRMGARPIPCAVGRYPGNIDIMFRIVKSFQTGYLMQGFAELLEEYQTTIINTRILWEDQIICIDEGVLKFMFVTGFEYFERGDQWHERMDKLFGGGIFNTDGEPWKKNRATARPFFSKDRTSDFAIFAKYTDVSLDILAKRAAKNEACDVQDLFSRFTLDTASEFLFGIPLDTLQKALPEAGRVKIGPRGSLSVDVHNDFDAFTEAFEEVQEVITRRGQLGSVWPLFELLKDNTESGIQVVKQWLDPLVHEAIERKIKRREAGLKLSLDNATYLDFLADNTDNTTHIRFELLNILLASRDTTAGLLTFAVYFLCLHPNKQTRLRAEVIEYIGKDGQLDYSRVKDMKFLDAVIKETLRLFPPVITMLRCSKDVPLVVPSADGTPLYLPPKTQVIFSSFLVQRRRDLWGDTCDDFNPDRWSDPNLLSQIGSNPLMYFPFHAGPRLCLGQNFAMNEAAYYLASLLQRFEKLELAPDAQPAGSLPPTEWKSGAGRQSYEKIWPTVSFTVYAKGGMWIRATEGTNI